MSFIRFACPKKITIYVCSKSAKVAQFSTMQMTIIKVHKHDNKIVRFLFVRRIIFYSCIKIIYPIVVETTKFFYIWRQEMKSIHWGREHEGNCRRANLISDNKSGHNNISLKHLLSFPQFLSFSFYIFKFFSSFLFFWYRYGSSRIMKANLWLEAIIIYPKRVRNHSIPLSPYSTILFFTLTHVTKHRKIK